MDNQKDLEQLKESCKNGTTRDDGYFRNANGDELCWCCKKQQLEKFPCNNCQGGGCTTCGGSGYWLLPKENTK